MIHRIPLIAASAIVAFLAALLAPTPAYADSDMPPHGFTQTNVCVVRTDAATGWRIGAAVRAWNAAQPYVHLSMDVTPDCDVIEIREFAGPEHPDWNGYVDWAEGTLWEMSPTYGRQAYRSARVWLNHATLVESFKPKYKGTDRMCWRKRVVAHEIGHALGLNHTTGPESVMSYDHDYVRYCGTPSAGDAAALAALYTPVVDPIESEGDGVGPDEPAHRVADYERLVLG